MKRARSIVLIFGALLLTSTGALANGGYYLEKTEGRNTVKVRDYASREECLLDYAHLRRDPNSSVYEGIRKGASYKCVEDATKK
jgi:hypothetical protein